MKERRNLKTRAKMGIPALLLAALFIASCGGRAGEPGASYGEIIIKPFSVSGARMQENPDVRAYAEGLPDEFSSLIKEYIAAYGAEQPVIVNGSAPPHPGALYVEGAFTDITTGSSAARTFGDFTGGKSTLKIIWTITRGDGTRATYSETSHTATGAKGATVLRSDAKRLAKHVAASIIRNLH